jgi:hypothetical protein
MRSVLMKSARMPWRASVDTEKSFLKIAWEKPVSIESVDKLIALRTGSADTTPLDGHD